MTIVIFIALILLSIVGSGVGVYCIGSGSTLFKQNLNKAVMLCTTGVVLAALSVTAMFELVDELADMFFYISM